MGRSAPVLGLPALVPERGGLTYCRPSSVLINNAGPCLDTKICPGSTEAEAAVPAAPFQCRNAALAAQNHGVMRVIHMSALGASLTSRAISDRTKAEGEEAVRAAFPQATIVRPSLTYGEDDHFFSRFAALIRSSPVLPLIGGGTTKFPASLRR
jgi:uncharacterized protein YbjT (DUF2867 family)